MITADKIITIVSDYFNVDKNMLNVKSRRAEYVKARHLAMYFCRHKTEWSYREVGNLFNRDHASVVHAIKSVNDRLDTEKVYKQDFENIEILIEQAEEDYLISLKDEEVYQESDFYK